MNKFVLVRADDWEGLYVDGKMAQQHHHVQLYEILDILADNGYYLPFTIRWVTDEYDHELSEMGQLPDDLSEVELAEE